MQNPQNSTCTKLVLFRSTIISAKFANTVQLHERPATTTITMQAIFQWCTNSIPNQQRSKLIPLDLYGSMDDLIIRSVYHRYDNGFGWRRGEREAYNANPSIKGHRRSINCGKFSSNYL